MSFTDLGTRNDHMDVSRVTYIWINHISCAVLVLRQKREKLSIIENILRTVKERPELKTNIAYKSRLDSRTITKYLPLIVELKLVTLTSSGKYAITKKGVEFLKQYAKMKRYNAT